MGVLVCTQAVEEGRPHTVAHVINIASTGIQRIPVVMLHAQSLLLRETTLATAPKLLLLAQFEQRSAHVLVRMVQALLLDDLDVWAVRFHHNDSLVRLRVAITQHACIHQVVASNGARPQSLGSFHLHSIRTAMVVDTTVLSVVHVPGVKGCSIVSARGSLQATTVAVGRENDKVDNEPSHHLDHCRHTMHRHVATLLLGAIEADHDWHWLVTGEVGVHLAMHCPDDGNTPLQHILGCL